MKSLLIIFMFAPIMAYAQLLPGGEKERYEESKDNSGGAGSLYSTYELKGMTLSDNFSIEFSTKQGYLFNRLVVGGNVNFRLTKTVEDPRYVDIRTVQSYFTYNHVGAFTDYIIPISKKAMLTIGTLANIGYTSYELANTGIANTPIGDFFFIAEPNVNFAYKIYDNYRLNIGGSYRKTFSLGRTAYPADYFSGYGISVGVKIAN